MTGGGLRKESWVKKRLEEIGTTQTGSTPKTIDKACYGDFIPFIKPADFKGDGSLDYQNEGLSDRGLEQTRKVSKGSVLMVCIGATIGKCGWCDRDVTTNQQTNALTPIDGVSYKFVYYQMLTEDFQRRVLFNSSQATLPIINKSKWSSLSVWLPPTYAEQQRIVGILDEAFDVIATAKANAARNLQNARAIFESHLQSVFNQRGEGWIEEPIGSFCDVKHGFAFDGAEFSSEVPKDFPLVITPGNFTEDGKLLFNERNTKRFSGEPPAKFFFDLGDLVVVMTDLSSKMKILGKPAFVDTDNVLHNQRIGRVVFFNDRIEKRLLYYFMMSESYLENIKGSATGTMVRHTAPKRILSNLIPYPRDRKRQQVVVKKLDSLREEIQRLEFIYEQKLAALDELKKSLLDQAFSGQL